MSNNRMNKPKNVRSVKGQPQVKPDAPTRREIPVNHGNAPILTVQFLNSINDSLIEIKDLLKDGRP